MAFVRSHRVLVAVLIFAPATAFAGQAAAPASASPNGKKAVAAATASTKSTKAARQARAASAVAPASATEAAARSGAGSKSSASPTTKAAPGNVKGSANGGRGTTASLGAASGPMRLPGGRSVGSPTEGHLIGGAHLGDAPYLRVYPVYSSGDVRWGVESLVGLVDRAARSVRKQFPDAVLSVGHLSKAGGGELDHHASHESGRDADIGFYVRSATGKPLLSDHMVPFAGDGTAPTWPGAFFDEARNWAFVAALVGDGRARVTHVFVATPIRQRLLAYAAKIGAPMNLRIRASEVLAQPHGALPHDDHFHVRIACPSGMDKCIEHPTAHHRLRQGGATATHGHPAHPSRTNPPAGSASGSSARTAGTPATPAVPSAPQTRARPSLEPKTPPGKPLSPREDEESAKTDSFMPSLAPIVPGLDSAVIPAPLEGAPSTWGTDKGSSPPSDPISDPDGVLGPP